MRNWVKRKLGDVCDFQGGSQPPKSNFIFEPKKGYVRFLQIRDFSSDKNITYIPESKKNRYCNEDDILLGRYGASVGKVLVNKAGAYNVAVMKTIPNPDLLHKRYLFFYLTSDEFQGRLAKVASRSAQDGFSKDDIFDFPILIPPFPEQQRIVAILDETFAAIAKAKANAEQNLRNTKELFESYLQSVFENKGEGWEEKTLGEIAFVKSGGTPSRSKKEYWDGNIAWYSSGELNELYTKDPERYINELAIHNSNAKLFPKGSLLIGMYDTAALKMSLLNRDAAFNQAIAGVKPNDKIDLTFILHSINSIKPDLLNLRRGVRQKNLSLEKIKNIPILLPSLTVQKIIVQKLNVLSVETKKLETIYQQKLNDLEELKKSILQKAFSGELKTDKDIAA